MRNAYKCNACGLISYNPGDHHDQPMVKVLVEENIPIKASGPPVPSAPVTPSGKKDNIDPDSSDEE